MHKQISKEELERVVRNQLDFSYPSSTKIINTIWYAMYEIKRPEPLRRNNEQNK